MGKQSSLDLCRPDDRRRQRVGVGFFSRSSEGKRRNPTTRAKRLMFRDRLTIHLPPVRHPISQGRVQPIRGHPRRDHEEHSRAKDALPAPSQYFYVGQGSVRVWHLSNATRSLGPCISPRELSVLQTVPPQPEGLPDASMIRSRGLNPAPTTKILRLSTQHPQSSSTNFTSFFDESPAPRQNRCRSRV